MIKHRVEGNDMRGLDPKHIPTSSVNQDGFSSVIDCYAVD